jgi:hypothetical protein
MHNVILQGSDANAGGIKLAVTHNIATAEKTIIFI